MKRLAVLVLFALSSSAGAQDEGRKDTEAEPKEFPELQTETPATVLELDALAALLVAVKVKTNRTSDTGAPTVNMDVVVEDTDLLIVDPPTSPVVLPLIDTTPSVNGETEGVDTSGGGSVDSLDSLPEKSAAVHQDDTD